jgi:hypothetical protein
MANNHYTPKVLPVKDFFKQINCKIKICKKNITLRSKLSVQEDSLEEDYDTTLLRVIENSYRKHKKIRYYTQKGQEEKPGLKLDSGSSFILFILRKKHYRDVFPDIELFKYKQVCSEMISKLSNCHEAHFGLAKILTHESNYELAEQHVKIALSEEKNSEMYNIWYVVLKSLSTTSKQNAISTKKSCESNE